MGSGVRALPSAGSDTTCRRPAIPAPPGWASGRRSSGWGGGWRCSVRRRAGLGGRRRSAPRQPAGTLHAHQRPRARHRDLPRCRASGARLPRAAGVRRGMGGGARARRPLPPGPPAHASNARALRDAMQRGAAGWRGASALGRIAGRLLPGPRAGGLRSPGCRALAGWIQRDRSLRGRPRSASTRTSRTLPLPPRRGNPPAVVRDAPSGPPAVVAARPRPEIGTVCRRPPCSGSSRGPC